jgi:protein disulfide-isomerase
MRQQFAVEINSGPWGINSHSSLVGHKIAVEQGKGDAYHEAVLEAYWLKGKSIEDADVLADIAENIGLAPDAFRFALRNPGYEEQVMQDILQAQMSGIDAVPALVFNEKYLFKGAGTYETLVMMLERVQQIEAEEASE